MNITRLAIEKSRLTIVFVLIIVVGGFIAYNRLPRAFNPGFTIRVAQVVTYFPGAAPERVEQLVTDKLEKAIQEIPELDYIQSRSKTGVSILFVFIKQRYDEMRPIWDNLRRKVDRVRPDLPEGVVGPFVNDEFGDVFGIVLAVTGEGYSYAELKEVTDSARDELLLLESVGKVEIYGAQEERVFVEYENARLAEIGISPYQLSRILESRNIIIPGGEIRIGPERIVLEPSGNFDSIDELAKTVINIPGSYETIFLEDIARISRGYIDPPRTRMRANGSSCLGLAVSMRDGANLIRLGEEVDRLIERLQRNYPIGIEFEKVNFMPVEVNGKVIDFRNNLIMAVLVVAGVMLIILGIRTGLIVASLIPMVILMSLMLMFFFDIGIDQVSLAALILSLGILVDNGIVMSESIMVSMARGRKPIDAAVASSKQLVIPLLTSSLTTAAAFLPIALANSESGEYTTPLFKVVTIALLSSWFLSLTAIPLISTKFIRAKQHLAPDYQSRFYRTYRSVLLSGLRHRAVALALILAAFGASIHVAGLLPKMFFPPSERAYFKADLWFPPGTAIESNIESVRQIERFMEDELLVEEGGSGVTGWAAYIGNGGPRYVLQHTPEVTSSDYSLLHVNVSALEVIDEMMSRLEGHLNRNFPDITPNVRRFMNGPPIDHPVEVLISGADPATLYGIVEQVKDQLRQIPGTKNINDDWGRRVKKFVVAIDQPRARRAGVTSRDIAVSLQTGLSGLEMTEYREGDEIIPVTLRSDAAGRLDVAGLESLSVHVQSSGKSVPLLQVADIRVEWQPGIIYRRNRQKTITVSADLLPGYLASEVTDRLIPWLENEKAGWDLGYRYTLEGEYSESNKADSSIMEKLYVGIFIIILLLVAQFNSIRRTLIILLTIPLGFIGVVGGLFAADLYFGFMTLLGMIALSGIVINNAIVLLERIKYEIDEVGRSQQEAILVAAQRRCRPILMTTVTTVFGMAPLYFGGAMWKPLTMALISGLIFATVLTLGLVPILYSLFFRVSYRS